MTRLAASLFLILILTACGSQEPPREPVPPAPPMALDQPNIVLVVFEDMGARIGAFGDPVANTPVLDAFARESIKFPNTFTTAGICAPSRSALITGMHQQGIGTMHMRTTGASGLPPGGPMNYEPVLPLGVKAFPEYLRAAGYHTSNNGKTDYQFGEPFTVWDHNGYDEEWWAGRDQDQPFFAMINLYESHESFMWPTDREPNGPVETAVQARNAQTFAGRTLVVSPDEVIVPPYLPDTPVVRRDIATHYDNITFAEQTLGRIQDRLIEEGIINDTIIIVTTDHGDGLPRMKRALYDSGIKVPMMVRFPDGRFAGETYEGLISFLDLAPTIMALAGLEPKPHFEGDNFLGEPIGTDRDYVFGTLDRADSFMERQKSARDARFKYIRNYLPDQAYFQQISFRNSLPTMQEIWRTREEETQTDAQAFYHQVPRPVDELYDTTADPHEVMNLAGDAAYAEDLARLQRAMDAWIDRTGDLSELSELEMIESFWPGLEQPLTSAPTISSTTDGSGVTVTLSTETEGASIGYQIGDMTDSWSLYTGPFTVAAGTEVRAKAIRYGFAESEVSAAPL